MDLRQYLSKMPRAERSEFATRCETTLGHLQNVMYGKLPATDLAVNIERESGQAVRRWELRADWYRHWPELIGTPGSPAVPAAWRRAA